MPTPGHQSELTGDDLKEGRIKVRKSLPISITQDLIETSERRSSSHCMIADAVKDAGRRSGMHMTSVAVDLQTIRFTDKTAMVRYIFLTPRLCQQALVDFDQGIHTEVFNTTLRNPTIVSAGFRRGSTNSKGKKKPKGPKPSTPESAKKSNGSEIDSPGTRAQLIVTKSRTRNEGSRGVHKLVSAPDMILGGTAPPLGSFARRRSFGLYALRP